MDFYLTSQKIKMPQMIYGTAWKKENTAELVLEALEQGFRGVDTACQPRHYFQPGVGLALKEFGKRDEVFLQTKFTPFGGQDPETCPYDPELSIRDQVIVSVETALRELKTDYIDSMLLHSPLPTTTQTMEAYAALEEFVEKGVIKQIGISNCYDYHEFVNYWDLAKIKPSVLQNRFYEDSAYDQKLREFCSEHHVIYQSFWSLTANGHKISKPVFGELSKKYGVSNEVIFYRFLIECGIAPLNGTTSREHMKEDLKVFDFSLTKEEVKSIKLVVFK
jgi:diketogulonate reductase-like aldo/keto reductase